MIEVYVYKGEYAHGEESWPLIMECARTFCGKYCSFVDVERLQIGITKKGKPYFKNLKKGQSLEFSISNTEGYWACAMSTEPCGLDIQIMRDSNGSWKKVSERKYNPAERNFVMSKGKRGFYNIWTRKEALGKMTGEGVFAPMKKDLIGKSGTLKEYVLVDGKRAYFRDFKIGKEIAGSICGRESAYRINTIALL